MYVFLLLLFILFHSFIFVFPRVVFTKNVSPSHRQLVFIRTAAFGMVLFAVFLYYYYT